MRWMTGGARGLPTAVPSVGMVLISVAVARSTGPGLEIGFAANGHVFETWKVKSVGSQSKVVYDVDFKIFAVERTLTIEPADGGTRVVWRETGEINNPLFRYMTLAGSEDPVHNFDEALAALGRVASTGP